MVGSASGADPVDADLVAQALAGRQAGYAGLVARHRDAVFRLARNHLGAEADALDVTQECFVAAFMALSRYDRARPFRTWVLRIALNKCHDWARRRTVRRLFTFARPLDDALDVADHGPDPEAALVAADEVARIRRAIAALPANLKEPLLLCALEGLSQDEAATVLGTSRKAIETRIYRARKNCPIYSRDKRRARVPKGDGRYTQDRSPLPARSRRNHGHRAGAAAAVPGMGAKRH